MNRRHVLMPLVFALGGLCLLPQAARAVTCATFSSPGWSLTYDPTVGVAATTTSTVTVTCTRQTGDAKNTTLTVSANSGLQPVGTINQATNTASLLQYNNYTNATYTLVWGTAGSTLSLALAFPGAAGTTASATATFYARIPAAQTGVTAGTYTDTVTMTLSKGATPVSTATFPVTVTVSPKCAITTPPGAVTLTYTSFQAATAAGSTGFAATCTNALPYTLSLDATSGTLLGLTYTLAVPGGPFSGTGLTQSYTINGAIAGGQAGTCATATCTASATHSVIITY